MARAKSTILSPADKKAVVGALKTQIKETKDQNKRVVSTIKTAKKAYTDFLKVAEKEVTTGQKALAKLQADLDAINPPKMAA